MCLSSNFKLISRLISFGDIFTANDPSNTWGKCSHGGILDSSQDIVAIGGINKETSNPEVSPHYDLHELAAKLAIEGGIAFFDDTGLNDH